ncbi:MAG: VWA domain-containing protein [Candidatus Obscuribacterales bacterium]|nr:VWA domain-containing protein [Candidatus Obscuribacterales bacterium]
MNLKQSRKQSGISVILLVTGIAIIVLPIIAIFSFEIGRANLGTQQLKNAADSAALGAVATMASNDNPDLAQAQTNAKQVALNLFKQNSILGNQLSDSVLGSSRNPAALHGEVQVQFLDPNTLRVVPDGDPNGKIVRLTASYGMEPAFGRYLGINRQVLLASSNGAVPQLDVVICFDISGSIDDQTRVTVLKRQWDKNIAPLALPAGSPNGSIVYKTPSSPKSSGKIFDLVSAPPSGTGLNGYGLQNLQSADTSYSGLVFSEKYAKDTRSLGLRSGGVVPEGGRAPGNFYGAPSLDSNSLIFTDMVVNLDGKDVFAGYTSSDGFNFPDLATLVEASRGNLESDALKASSKADTVCTVAAKSGYQAAYNAAALHALQPLQDAKDATDLFCRILHNDTDAHFGLVTFDGGVGSNASSTESHRTIDDGVPYGESKAQPFPLVPLDAATGVDHYLDVKNALPNCVAKGSTNIGLAVKTAVDQLNAHARTNAVKAIILFTDGQPTAHGPLDNDNFQNARKAAVLAKNAGIPVYTIGLATNPQIAVKEDEILNDRNSDPETGGIAAISGQGALYYLVNDSSQLRDAFRKIARHLVQLVQDQVNES